MTKYVKVYPGDTLVLPTGARNVIVFKSGDIDITSEKNCVDLSNEQELGCWTVGFGESNASGGPTPAYDIVEAVGVRFKGLDYFFNSGNLNVYSNSTMFENAVKGAVPSLKDILVNICGKASIDSDRGGAIVYSFQTIDDVGENFFLIMDAQLDVSSAAGGVVGPTRFYVPARKPADQPMMHGTGTPAFDFTCGCSLDN